MKKYALTLLLLLVSVLVPAQVIDNPRFKARTGSILNITRIERTPEATRLHIHAVFRPKWWIKVESDSYLEDAETGKRYAFVRAEGIEPGKETYMPESGQMDFVLVYEPLPAETRRIHHIAPKDDEARTFDIELTPPDPKAASPLEAVRGNWFDAASGRWTIGLYDSVAIADNRIYNYRQVRKRGKGIELTLQGREKQDVVALHIAPQRDGTARLTRGKERTTLTRRPLRTPVEADNGFGEFFRADTAVLQGIIDGYDPRLGFETGLIYLDDLASGADRPIAVQIAPDGTFSCRLPLKHPMSLALLTNNDWMGFCLEPGATQTMYISWEDVLDFHRRRDRRIPIRGLQYMGDDAHLSYLEMALSVAVPTYDYDKFRKALQTLSPAQFRESLRPDITRWQQAADSLLAIYSASQKAVKLIRLSTLLNEGKTCLDFAMYRDAHFASMQNPENEAAKIEPDESFYDFLRRMPLDEPEAMACDDIDRIVNRFEFMPILWKLRSGMEVHEDKTQEEIDRLWYEHHVAQEAREDSLVEALCGKAQPFMWQLARARSLKSDLGDYTESPAIRRDLLARRKQMAGEHPFLVSELQRIYDEVLAKERTETYALPEGKAADIFRNIIREHAGKVLFVDFWATTCAPCRSGIERTAELRRKYKDHPEFKFIYITGADDSPREAYDQYVEKHLKGEATYYVSAAEFAYLRELFKFNGIPHYELVEKDGTIHTQRMETYSLENYLKERFPLDEPTAPVGN